jgi:hypothetical protein
MCPCAEVRLRVGVMPVSSYCQCQSRWHLRNLNQPASEPEATIMITARVALAKSWLSSNSGFTGKQVREFMLNGHGGPLLQVESSSCQCFTSSSSCQPERQDHCQWHVPSQTIGLQVQVHFHCTGSGDLKCSTGKNLNLSVTVFKPELILCWHSDSLVLAGCATHTVRIKCHQLSGGTHEYIVHVCYRAHPTL